MARVRIEEVVDHLRTEMRRALEAAIQDVAPDAEIDPHALFRAFKRQVGRKCSTWERVPDQLVDTE